MIISVDIKCKRVATFNTEPSSSILSNLTTLVVKGHIVPVGNQLLWTKGSQALVSGGTIGTKESVTLKNYAPSQI